MTQTFTCPQCGRAYVSGDVVATACCLKALEARGDLDYAKNTTVKP